MQESELCAGGPTIVQVGASTLLSSARRRCFDFLAERSSDALRTSCLPAAALNVGVPDQYVVSNSTLVAHLERVASRKERAIVFTTAILGRQPKGAQSGEMAMLSNFCW